MPDDIQDLVNRADLEGDGQFEFADVDADDAAEATLAQLVRIDAAKSLAANWSIPPPRPDAPLHELTGHFDTDENHPGTRHQANSTLLIPCVGSADDDGCCLADGTMIEVEPRQTPPLALIRRVFESAIPVSYPNPGWASELRYLTGGWDRTPVARAQLLNVSAGDCQVGEWTLRVDNEVGLIITKGTA